MNPAPVKAISDQFASSKDVVAKAFDVLGRESNWSRSTGPKKTWRWRPASILARDGFVKGLVKLEKQFNVELPKGASTAVDEAAKKFVGEQGGENLSKYVKMSFPHGLSCAGSAASRPKKRMETR